MGMSSGIMRRHSGGCIADLPPTTRHWIGFGLYVGAVTLLVWTNPADWLATLLRLLRVVLLQRP